MANQQAREDQNKVKGLIGHSSIKDPSETRRVLVTDGSVHVKLRADGSEEDDVTIKTGAYSQVKTYDLSQYQLLTDVLKELKKMNLHLSLMTDTIIKNEEIK